MEARAYDLMNCAANLLQREDQRNKVERPVKNCGSLESNLTLYIYVNVCLVVAARKVNRKELGAIPRSQVRGRHSRNRCILPATHSNALTDPRRRCHDDKQSVLVQIIQLLNHQQFRDPRVFHVEWLATFYAALQSHRHTLQTATSDSVLIVLLCTANGKLVNSRDRATLAKNYVGYEMVEAGSQLMYDFAGQYSESKRHFHVSMRKESVS